MAEYYKPGVAFTSRFSAGIANTGLVGTVRFRLLDADPAVDDPVIAVTTVGIVEDPTGSGDYLYNGAALPTTVGKYYPAWDLGSGQLYYDEDIVVSFGAPEEGPSGNAYASVEELARILRVDAVARADALERVLVSAAGEIDAEVGAGTADALSGWELALAAEVNLERAVEHWQQMQSPFGIVGLGADTLPTITGRDSWDRHAHKLAALKRSWGIA